MTSRLAVSSTVPAVDDGAAGVRLIEGAHLAAEGDDGSGACRHAVIGPGGEVELLEITRLLTLQPIASQQQRGYSQNEWRHHGANKYAIGMCM